MNEASCRVCGSRAHDTGNPCGGASAEPSGAAPSSAAIAEHPAGGAETREERNALTAPRERLFPIQSERDARPHPPRIPWSLAEKAYSVYSGKYGHSQSLERLAERGGFCPGEMDLFVPDWREQADEITALRAEVASLRALVERQATPSGQGSASTAELGAPESSEGGGGGAPAAGEGEVSGA